MLQHFDNRAQRLGFVGLALFTALAVSASVASVWSQLGQASPGFIVWDNLVVPAIGSPGGDDGAPGVPLRAILEAADDVPLHDAGALRAYLATRAPGTPVRYRFQHDGGSSEVTLPTRVLHARDVLPIYGGYFLNGVAFLVTALVVFYLQPSAPAAHACVAMAAVMGASLVLALDLFSASWLDRVYFCAESAIPSSILHLALAFPETRPILRRRPRLLWGVYLVGVALAIGQNLLLHTDPARQLALNSVVYGLTAAAILGTIGALLQSYRRTRNPRARQQVQVVLAGSALASAVPAIGLFEIAVFGADLPMNQILAPFMIIFPLSIAYAVARHDLFGVDRFLRRGVVYAALTLFVFASYAATVVLAERWLGKLPRGAVPLYLLAVLAVFDPLRARIQAGVDRLFYRHGYTYRGTVEATSRALVSVLNTERIAAAVLDTLTGEMAIEWAAIILLQPTPDGVRGFGRPPSCVAAVTAAFPAGDALLHTLAVGPRAVSGDAAVRTPLEREFAARSAPLGLRVAFPVRFRDEPLGVLLAGDKKSGAVFTDEDHHLITTMANQAALAFNNARAYEIIRETQTELVAAERMAAVGELAAAVAHGIRNPLAGIRATAQVAHEDLPEGSALAEDLADIITESDRLERRVRSVLDLTRPIEVTMAPGDLGRFLHRFVETAGARVPSGIALSFEQPAALPPVPFDGARLQEVLDTLVVNAVEALGGHGTIRVVAEATHDGDAPAVIVAVTDDGPGMPPHVLARVFDLFYTTKATGTGIGLAMARRLIERQGGTLDAVSTVGAGTTFRIRLPASAGAATDRS